MELFSNHAALNPPTKLSSFARGCVLIYVCVSIIYCTTSVLIAGPSFLEGLVDGSFPFTSFVFGNLKSHSPSNNWTQSHLAESSVNVASEGFRDMMHWERPYPIGTSRHLPATLDSHLFLSKAFAQARSYSSYRDNGNLEIIPFYYRASGVHHQEDITITTLVTRDRFGVFKQLVDKYRGPISVAVHIPISGSLLASSNSLHQAVVTDEETKSLLQSLHSLYLSSPLMALLVDVHLVLSPSPHDRYFNAWRNVARLFARTDFIMMLDVDFVPCTDFRRRILNGADEDTKNLLRSGDAALVIPAFEYVNYTEGLNHVAFPTDKETLISLVNASRISMFHRTWLPGHNSTDYARLLYRTEPGEVYRVTTYQHAYEPYVIMRREGPPWCDERFIGYGGNKAACLFEMYLSGISFYVLSDDFLIHRSHPYEEEARKQERRYNRKIYADFREEICLKYLKSFYDEGSIGTTKARNVREECQKIKGLSHIAVQLIEGN